MADKKISELTAASEVKNEDNLELSQDTGSGLVSLKATILAIANKMLKGINFSSDLQTTNKTVIGAINEVAQGGGGSGVDWVSNGYLGAKNLNSTPYYYESQTSNGITWTVNSDGTVTADGTATAQSTFLCHARNQADNSLTLPNGNYILSGCVSGGADNKYYIVIGRTHNGAYQGLASDYGSGANVTLNGDDYSANEVRLHFAIVVRNGVTVNNITFKPMVRLASDSDATFRPYAMTNLELTKSVESGGGGGTGGHTIIDEDGNTMTARSGLQFTGAVEVTDDSVNNKTIVDVLGGDFYNPVIYSTTEREIGVWTDGKPLYEKTIDFGNLGNNIKKSVAHGISNIEKIWVHDGFATDSNNYFGLNRPTNANNYNWNASADATNVSVEDYTNLTSLTAFVVVRYTKTTDVAGSGSWTPQGVPTHHYSTDEQVIGTYLDETLYEKTWVLENAITLASNTWTAIPPIPKTLFSKIPNCEVINNAGSYVGFIQTAFDSAQSDYLRLLNVRNANVDVKEITLRYTKSS